MYSRPQGVLMQELQPLSDTRTRTYAGRVLG